MKQLHLLHFTRTLILTSILLLSDSIQGISQTPKRATEFLNDLKKPTLNITTKFLEFSRYELLHGWNRRSVREKNAILAELGDVRRKIEDISSFNSQNDLKISYIRYLDVFENCLRSIPEFSEESLLAFNFDSAQLFQEMHLQELDNLIEASLKLNSDLEIFCIKNRFIGKRTSGALIPKQKEARKIISFAVSIENPVIKVRRMNHLFFEALEQDTGNLAEQICRELFTASVESKADILAVPNFPGDRKLKRKGILNMSGYKRNANRDYKYLLGFRVEKMRIKELEKESEKNKDNPSFNNLEYLRTIKRFSTLETKNNELLKRLSKSNKSLEDGFDEIFLEFIRNNFKI